MGLNDPIFLIATDTGRPLLRSFALRADMAALAGASGSCFAASRSLLPPFAGLALGCGFRVDLCDPWLAFAVLCGLA